jgi:hypothetical protein
MRLAGTGLSTEGQAVAAIAAKQGDEQARKYGEALGFEEKMIAAALAAGAVLRGDMTGQTEASLWGERTGISALEGLIRGIGSKEEEAVRKARSSANRVFAGYASVFLPGSPSRRMAVLGTQIMQGLALGIVRSTEEGVRAAAHASELITSTFSTAAPSLALPTVGPSDLAAVNGLTAASTSAREASQTIIINQQLLFQGRLPTDVEAEQIGARVTDGSIKQLQLRQIAVDVRTRV